ncbi:Transmembrane protein 43 [Cryptotermes secundus]|uniref:Transmembrane protein 43 n=1 Tax=Cryptotermes secundus TaxID=105785 RepID=A0A2J7QST1_9NEOP|nr:Transmembrane protein 43 [Cryptotermes secundus]
MPHSLTSSMQGEESEAADFTEDSNVTTPDRELDVSLNSPSRSTSDCTPGSDTTAPYLPDTQRIFKRAKKPSPSDSLLSLVSDKLQEFPDAPRPYVNQDQRRCIGSIREQLKLSWLTSLIGCVLFAAGMRLLFWNEGQVVQTARLLEEALNTIIPVQYTSVVMAENNGKLVHFSGALHVGELLTEPEYGVAVPAAKLKRRVQMYQWVEEEQNSELMPGDHEYVETSYSYTMEWRDKLIDSSLFYSTSGHHNPKEFPLKSIVYVNEHVIVGSCVFGAALKEKFSDYVLVTSDERPERRDIKLHAGLYYHSQDVWNPEVGDIRVQFSYAGKAGEVVSVVGMQVGKEIRPYQTFSGDEILMLRYGRLTVEEMFLEERVHNQWLTWALRGLGWLMMFLGANCLTNILHLIVSRYSVLHDLLVLGVNSMNVAISTSASLLVTSFAWIWYHPVLGGFLMIGAAVPFLYSAIQLYCGDHQENRYQRL